MGLCAVKAAAVSACATILIPLAIGIDRFC
jgi:hypothetical protein